MKIKIQLLTLSISIILLFSNCNTKKDLVVNTSDRNLKNEKLLYFGQKPPTTIPKKFAPGIISKSDRHEFGCTLSEDGKEFYFGVDNEGKAEIYKTAFKDGQWTSQENIFPGDSCSYNDPMLSMDEKRLYFISNRPTQKNNPLKDIDIWYIEKIGLAWSEPINVGKPINNELDQYYISFSEKNTMYFASKDTVADAPRYAFDIYKSQWNDNYFSAPQKLPPEINTNRYEADVFIAHDETYMIFCSIRRDGLGSGDLYISFKNEEDNWTKAISMGNTINTEHHELCPYVTRDGNYLFYTSNQDIYWVSTEIIVDLKSQIHK